ncbi:MAG: type II toxin-antitoxin system RelE/ParE family toxin [Proteobacteria bacterium]|nr:type II toxin-antitoxin system RelE/ParE family toxin [Pseudomonadota bacterium]
MKVIWSPTAERNLDAIWEYIAQDDHEAADRIAERLRSAANGLMTTPLIGRAGRAIDTRELVVAGTPYLLIYRVLPGKIEIARVVHGKQHWPPEG